MEIFGKHRVRATFYHMVALVFLLSTALWYYGLLSDKASYIITAVLFVVDYIAEMYDPHPDNPGPWYSHFHRAYNPNEPERCEFENVFKCHVTETLDKYEDEFKHVFKT